MKRENGVSQGTRGAAVKPPAGKTRITIRIDDDILNWFRDQVRDAGGGNYQSLINQALRAHMTHEPLEKLLRRVVRKELKRRKVR